MDIQTKSLNIYWPSSCKSSFLLLGQQAKHTGDQLTLNICIPPFRHVIVRFAFLQAFLSVQMEIPVFFNADRGKQIVKIHRHFLDPGGEMRSYPQGLKSLNI